MIKDAKIPNAVEDHHEPIEILNDRGLLASSGPFTDVMPDLKSIMDTPKIQSLMDDFFEITGVGVAIMDLSGHLLVATGWQDICTQFHRKNPEALKNCIESDVFLSQTVGKGCFLRYKCKNNLWDIVTPIYVGDRHMGNLFLGQFFFEGETLDYETFLKQADRYGFERGAYLSALDRVPRWSEDKVDTVMQFYVKLTNLISLLSYSNMVLDRENKERQLIESALREKEYFVNRILSTDPNGILIYDVLTDRVVFINPKSTELFGLMPDEFAALSDTVGSIVHPDDLSRALVVIEKVSKGKDDDVLEIEVRVRREDEWFWTHIYAVPFQRNKEGKIVQVLVTVQDITDRKRTEDELVTSKMKMTVGMDLARLVHWEYDVLADQFYFDDRFYAMYGTDSKREGGHLMSAQTYIREFIPSIEAPTVARSLDFILSQENKEDVSQLEHNMQRRDGEVRHILVRMNIIRDGSGRPIRTWGVNQDVTELKRAEEGLRKANDKLHLLSNITRHDINNQLVVLMGTVDLLKAQVTDPGVLNRLEKIKRSATNIREQAEFTQDYQDMGSTSPQWHNLGDLLKNLPVGREVGTMAIDEKVHCLSIYADPMLYKVFHNLIEDSIKYGARPTSVRIYLRELGDELLLVYEDDGPGIAMTDKRMMFQKGFGKGTGLGLFLSKEILGITGISIRENGEPGKGVRFEMSIRKGGFLFQENG